jgi:hypothetical protein
MCVLCCMHRGEVVASGSRGEVKTGSGISRATAKWAVGKSLAPNIYR